MYGMESVKTPVFTRRRRAQTQSRLLPYVLIAPLVVFIAALSLYPTILTFIDSFVSDNLLNPVHGFNGLSNYTHVVRDPLVQFSAGNTVIYMVFGVVISTILALVIALAVWRQFPARGIVLAVIVLPWALPGITEGIIWSWIYDPTFGVLNSVLKSLHVIHQYQLWISGNRVLSIFFIEVVQVWQMTPLSAVLILASLQTIPTELYDAAAVDGASRWAGLWRITLPLIQPGISIAVVEALIQSMNIFDQVYVLNGSATTGSSIMGETYNITFNNLNFGQGYALSFLMVFATMILSVGVLRLLYRKVEF